MARNEEKQLGRLNRLLLQQLDEEKLKKAPQRPGLGSLHTAAEVKKWLPSIKRDLDFYLKQSQVTCYPERQIEEFSVKIEQLTKEYKAFVRKIRELEPGTTAVPWTSRSYSRKRKAEDMKQTVSVSKEADSELATVPHDTNTDKLQQELTLIPTPILEKDDSYTDSYGYEKQPDIVYNADPDRENAALDFKTVKHSQLFCNESISGHQSNSQSSISEDRLNIDSFRQTDQRDLTTDKG